MLPNISEFSYGYAVTDELVNWTEAGIIAAPIFPSLYQEGQAGGGWDVMLNRPGIPLFLQFKLSHKMVHPNSSAPDYGYFLPPFYRMYLRPSRHSDQHEMLLDLEAAGNEVYYCAPAFHEPWELNDAFLNHQVKERSIWVRPTWIGPLPDDNEHHVSFQHPGQRYLCSKPHEFTENFDFANFIEKISSTLKENNNISLKENLFKTADLIATISGKKQDIPLETYQTTFNQMKSRSPIEQVAFYSHIYLDTQLFILSLRQ